MTTPGPAAQASTTVNAQDVRVSSLGLYWSRSRLLALNWAHAACRYSLISPAGLARRWIWAGGTGKAMMSGSSFGARSSIPLPWWLRPVL